MIVEMGNVRVLTGDNVRWNTNPDLAFLMEIDGFFVAVRWALLPALRAALNTPLTTQEMEEEQARAR